MKPENNNNPPCVDCLGPTIVDTTRKPKKDTEDHADGHHHVAYGRVRRYVCTKCGFTFTTMETYRTGRPRFVVKKPKPGRTITREEFDFAKLCASFGKAATGSWGEHKCARFAALVKQDLDKHYKTRQISATDIGERVLHVLRKHNELGVWIRYALAFYDLDEPTQSFEGVLEELREHYAQGTQAKK